MMLQRQPAYVSPLRAVQRVRVRSRRGRSRPDVAVLYGLAAVAGMVSGLVLSILG
jgi:hypothetical protein